MFKILIKNENFLDIYKIKNLKSHTNQSFIIRVKSSWQLSDIKLTELSFHKATFAMICKKCLPSGICLLTNLPRQKKIYIYDNNIINTPNNTPCINFLETSICRLIHANKTSQKYSISIC